MKYLSRYLWLGLLAPVLACAETAYVTDQVTTVLRTGAASTAEAVKTVTTGTALDVLERGAGWVRVRDPQGTEGWVDAEALASKPPAALQVRGLRAELDRTRAQLIQAQTQIDKNRAGDSAASGTDSLQTEINALRTQVTSLQGEIKQKDEQLAAVAANTSVSAPAAEDPSAPAKRPGIALWLVIAFAMLVLGFIGGVVWVRESIRRRMGGLYLRI